MPQKRRFDLPEIKWSILIEGSGELYLTCLCFEYELGANSPLFPVFNKPEEKTSDIDLAEWQIEMTFYKHGGFRINTLGELKVKLEDFKSIIAKIELESNRIFLTSEPN